jgi:hypothetical protein
MSLFSKLLLCASLAAGALFVQALPVAAQGADIQAGLCAGANLDVNDTSCSGGTDAVATINDLIRKVINLLSVIVGIVAVIMIMVGGFRYITSGGSDTGVTSAKNTILYAIIGLIIVALAQLLVRFVLRQVSGVSG